VQGTRVQDLENSTRGKVGRSCGRGSLTSSAEKILLADIQMEVVNSGSAVLDMYFLLISISIVFDVTLALVRYFLVKNILKQSRLQGDIRVRRHAAVNAVCGCGERVRESGRGGLLSWEVGCAERGCRGTLGCLRVVGRHSVHRDASSDDFEKKRTRRANS
jgi:hypothetical protein